MQTLETTEIADTTDDMQTIIHQGQPIRATLVNYLSGTIPTSTVDADGDEELFRDEAGRYYLRRTLNLLTDYHEDGGEGNIAASGRTLVHRINVNAAILWATTRLNSETLHLRQDAAALLMEGRAYFDPHPSHLNAEQRAMVSDPARFALGGSARPTGMNGTPDMITVPLTLPLSLYRQVLAMAYYDSSNTSLDAGARIVESIEGDVRAWHESGDTGPTPGEYLAEFEQELAAGLYPEVYPPALSDEARQAVGAPGRIVVELDDLASTMLRKACREGNECREAGEDLRDLVNAAVTFYLCGDKDDQHGEFDLNCGDEALERAKADRLAAGRGVA